MEGPALGLRWRLNLEYYASMNQDSTRVSLRYANSHVAAMHAYVPGMQPQGPGWVKLNTNENPYPPSPRVAKAITAALSEDGLRLRYYPNPTSAPLREAIATHHGLTPQQVLIGNGCDDILNLLIRVFAGPGKVAGMLQPSYSLYGVLSQIQPAAMRKVTLGRDLAWTVDDVLATGAKLFFLTNPNAPTGVSFPQQQIRELAERLDGILVIDETYAPFASDDATALVSEGYGNVVIARSFSKSHALAGLRVGYALAQPTVIDLLDCVRDSYNVDCLAQVGVLAALQDKAYYAKTMAKVKNTRDLLYNFYKNEMGWFCYPSSGNFHFVEPRSAAGQTGPEVAAELYQFLEKQRILVRYFSADAFTASFLRISVGSETESTQLQQALHEWFER